VGFGITATQPRVKQELKMVFGPVDADAALEVNSLNYGWTIGELYELNVNHWVGFVSRSQVESWILAMNLVDVNRASTYQLKMVHLQVCAVWCQGCPPVNTTNKLVSLQSQDRSIGQPQNTT
jgi:long-subunit fatty acid transport protein